MPERFLPFSEVQKITGGKSRTTIWRWEKAGLFPKHRKIGPNTNGWPESEVNAWVESQSLSAA